jgi:hypothetical protein
MLTYADEWRIVPLHARRVQCSFILKHQALLTLDLFNLVSNTTGDELNAAFFFAADVVNKRAGWSESGVTCRV